MYMKCFQAMGFLSRMLMPTGGNPIRLMSGINQTVPRYKYIEKALGRDGI